MGDGMHDIDMDKYGSVGFGEDFKPMDLDIMSVADARAAQLDRRLAGCPATDHDAPSTGFIFVPLMVILMLVLFMYRKPIQNYFSGSSSAKPSYGGLRNIRKKAPIRHF